MMENAVTVARARRARGMTKILLGSMLLLLVAASGCDGEADIGSDSDPALDLEPVACTSDAVTAEVAGAVVDPGTGTRFDVGVTSATAIGYDTGSAVLSLGDGALLLRVSFSCQTHAPGTYRLVADGQDGVECPAEVAGAVFGAIAYLPAERGTVIVDDSGNCLAGRVHADFGDRGELTGWFRAPWQAAP
jgi:hypothetical protein